MPTSPMQIRSIVAKEGLRGLYAGYGAFMLRDLPFDAIEFVAYEQLRKAAARMLQRDPNPAEVSIVGAIAGGFTGESGGEPPDAIFITVVCTSHTGCAFSLYSCHRVQRPVNVSAHGSP